MSTYACPVVELDIRPHPDADRLEVAHIGGYKCVVGLGQWKSGDRAVYIPDGSLLEDRMLARLDDTTRGYLGGSKQNRVRAANLRGVVSQGLLYACPEMEGHELGEDMAEVLGCAKYVPPVPIHMEGQITEGPKLNFDIEAWENHPDEFVVGEEVWLTEKLHGTCCVIGLTSSGEHTREWQWEPSVASKGLAAKGQAFDLDAEENDVNLYCRVFRRYETELVAAATSLAVTHRLGGDQVFILGEIYGGSGRTRVQDLDYGLSEPGYAVFDIRVGECWLPPAEMRSVAEACGLPLVPLLARGPWSAELLAEHRDAATTLGCGHVREGVVVRPAVERRSDLPSGPNDRRLGRVLLKAVSPDYLLRRGKQTEYE